MNDQLPAYVCPNLENRSDPTVVLGSGESTTASAFVEKLGGLGELRFMAVAKHDFHPDFPQVTWSDLNCGVVVSLAFPAGKDVHGRVVSAAVVVHLVSGTVRSFLSSLPSIPEDIRNSVEKFLSSHVGLIWQHIQDERSRGLRGGAYQAKKKEIPQENSYSPESLLS
jgi:hypothetical protein